MIRVLPVLLLLLGACRVEWRPPGRPTPVPTAIAVTPTAIAVSTPTPTAMPTPVVRQLTSGRAVFEVDLTDFRPSPPLDYYAFATLMWREGVRDAPALELSVRGLSSARCGAQPCGPESIGLVARFSGDIRADGAQPDEHKHCGSGVNHHRRLPIGPDVKFQVRVEWGSWGVEVFSPLASVRLVRGAPRVGFGWWKPGVPGDRGIGWAGSQWTLPGAAERVRLLEWTAVGEQGPLGACP